MITITLSDMRAASQDYSLRRGLSEGSQYQIERSVRIFGQFLGRDPEPTDLDDVTVSRWIQWLETRYAKRTVAGHRGNLMCLWRHLADLGVVERPGRVRRAPMPHPQPVAWTMAELTKIRQACYTARGTLANGVSRALYLSALFDTAYESGLRRSDLWRLERSQFGMDGVISLRQHKTQYPHEPQIRRETLDLVLQIPGPLPLSWHGNPSGFYNCWDRHVIRPTGVRRGALQQIRRSGATQVEMSDASETSRYLGHQTPSMKAHYVDRSQAYGPAPTPPPIPDSTQTLADILARSKPDLRKKGAG